MERTIASLRTQWEELELELLVPARFVPQQWEAIIKFRQDPIGFYDGFKKHLPLIVAHFKPEVCEQILSLAREKIEIECLNPEYGDPAVNEFYYAYRRDIEKIHYKLFGRSLLAKRGIKDYEFGYVKSEKTAALHVDDHPEASQFVSYLARVGALPFEVIDTTHVPSKITNTMMWWGGIDSLFGDVARSILRWRNILKPAPLDCVALMIGGDDGTPHCSSSVPWRGAYSAFLGVDGAIL